MRKKRKSKFHLLVYTVCNPTAQKPYCFMSVVRHQMNMQKVEKLAVVIIQCTREECNSAQNVWSEGLPEAR